MGLLVGGRWVDRRFRQGDRPTEAGWRLLTTRLRFDLVHVGHLKCNRRRIVDDPSLWPDTRDPSQWPGVDFDTPHGRA